MAGEVKTPLEATNLSRRGGPWQAHQGAWAAAVVAMLLRHHLALRLLFHPLQMAGGRSLSQEAGNPPCPMAVRCWWPGRGTQPTGFPGDGATSQAHTRSRLKPSFRQNIAVGLRHTVAATAGRPLRQQLPPLSCFMLAGTLLGLEEQMGRGAV